MKLPPLTLAKNRTLAALRRPAWATPDERRGGGRRVAPFLTALMLATGVPLVVAGAAAVTVVTACPPLCDDAGVEDGQRQAAVKAFLAQRYATAYGRFAQLADEGDTSAALIALTMVCDGPALFGSEWSATPGQLRRWTAMAVGDVEARRVRITEHDRGE